MSVRAYKVLEVQLDERPSFNCWHDEGLMDFLARGEMWDGRNNDGAGIVELNVATLQEALASGEVLKLNEDVRKALAEDIAWAKQNGRDYIRYECF